MRGSRCRWGEAVMVRVPGSAHGRLKVVFWSELKLNHGRSCRACSTHVHFGRIYGAVSRLF